MKKTVILLIFITVFAKSIGFIKDLVLANFYGVSEITDAYIIATTIPVLFIAFFSYSTSSLYIPVYNKIENENGLVEANKFSSLVINILLSVALVVCLFIIIFTEQLIYVLASGFNPSTVQLTVLFTRITTFTIVLGIPIAIFQSHLNKNMHFFSPAFSVIPMQIIIILGIIASYYYGYFYLPLAFLLGYLVKLLIIIFPIILSEFKYYLNFNYKNENFKKFMYLVFPIFLTHSIHDVNKIIDRTLASRIILGGISALNYAAKLNSFVQAVIVISITTATYPILAKLSEKKLFKELSDQATKSLIFMLFFMIPTTLLFISHSNQIIAILFERGNFDENAVKLTSSALLFYSIGMPFFGITVLITRVFYANSNTKIPFIAMLMAVIINIVLNLYSFIFTELGIKGLALATSLAAICSSVFLLFKFHNEVGLNNYRYVFSELFKISVTSTLMILVLWISRFGIGFYIVSDDLVFLMSVFVSGGFYMIVNIIFRTDSVSEISKIFERLFNKYKHN